MKTYSYHGDRGRLKLNSLEQSVYDYCLKLERERLRLPTPEEVSAQFGWTSRDAGMNALKVLVFKGWLRKAYEPRITFYIRRETVGGY